MNEAETRADLIDPKLKACGWGVVDGSKILRERDVCQITASRMQIGGGKRSPLIVDYILVYKGVKLAVVAAGARALIADYILVYKGVKLAVVAAGARALIADYILVYKGVKLAVVEARARMKEWEKSARRFHTYGLYWSNYW